MEISFSLAGKPMAKGRVRFVQKTGHTFTPDKTVRYEGQLAYAGQMAMNGLAPLEGALAVDVVVHMPIAPSWPKKKQQDALMGRLRPTTKPDSDNFAKMLDALNFICWVDDSQIVDLRVEKYYSNSPRMDVIIKTLDGTSVTE